VPEPVFEVQRLLATNQPRQFSMISCHIIGMTQPISGRAEQIAFRPAERRSPGWIYAQKRAVCVRHDQEVR